MPGRPLPITPSLRRNPGDSSGEATPVPIPNTAVKLSSAEDTERAAFRENRSSPGFLRFWAAVAVTDGRAHGRYHVGMVRVGAKESPDAGTAPRAAPGLAGPSRPRSPDDPQLALCPYLLVPAGGFRFAYPDREHRCTATRPFETLSTDKQRRLCLTAGHDGCPALEAARQRRAATFADAGIAIDTLQERRSRPLGRTTPVVLVGGRRSQGMVGTDPIGTRLPQDTARRPGSTGTRSGRTTEVGTRPDATGGRPGPARSGNSRVFRSLAGPAAAVVVVLAALAVLAARLPGTAGPSPAVHSPLATVAAAVSQPPTVAPAVVASPAATTVALPPPPTPSPAPVTPQPSSAATTTYRVKAGDTLSAIAARFGVSVSALQQANGITDPRLLRIGQVLQIP